MGDILRIMFVKVMRIVYKAQKKNTSQILLFLDDEKAFDWREWQYIHYVNKQFGLGELFQAWLRLLYKDQSAFIVSEGKVSDTIQINRGVRQGCSLSPLLFTLALEPMAISIRNNRNIAVFRVPGFESKLDIRR